ncbi:hypothetical protein O5282_27095 [Escherichia coli]|nr:hypothetical protein [Escherichia coli]
MAFRWCVLTQGITKAWTRLSTKISGALLAREIHADILVITTGVEKVSIHFGKPNQHALDTVDVLTMARYMQEGHFPPGSMLPKILASLEFLERGGKSDYHHA